MRSVLFIVTFFISIILVNNVYAQVRSNSVTTTVGTPTGPVPGASTTTNPTNSGPLGVTVTCPLFQNGQGIPRIICGTGRNYVNNCGHGAPPPYYLICRAPPYAVCPFSPQLKAAVDARPQTGNGNNAPVYFPFINGNQSVQWTKVSGPINLEGGRWGVKLEYTTIYNGKLLRIDFSHINQGNFPNQATSDQQLGVVKPGFDTDGGGHLHTAVSIDGIWGDSIDQVFICSNRSQ